MFPSSDKDRLSFKCDRKISLKGFVIEYRITDDLEIFVDHSDYSQENKRIIQLTDNQTIVTLDKPVMLNPHSVCTIDIKSKSFLKVANKFYLKSTLLTEGNTTITFTVNGGRGKMLGLISTLFFMIESF